MGFCEGFARVLAKVLQGLYRALEGSIGALKGLMRPDKGFAVDPKPQTLDQGFTGLWRLSCRAPAVLQTEFTELLAGSLP